MIDLGLLRNFSHSRFNIWLVVSTSVILGSIYIYFVSLNDLIVFPGKNDFKFYFFDDSGNGGNSKIIQHDISDTAINIDFNLKEGFTSPYIGISITPRKDSVLNICRYNRFHLEMEGRGIKTIVLSLFTPNRYYKHEGNSKELYFHSNFEFSRERKQYFIELDQLQVPDWWREVNNVSPAEKIKPDLKNVLHLNIGTGYTPILGNNSSIKIRSISFERENSGLLAFLITIEFMVVFLLLMLHIFRTFSKKRDIPITISYQPVEIKHEHRQSNSYLDYINNNFQENDLSLEQVSNHTGINQRRIANYIQQNYGCNFKTYINRMRISESKRLLKESELNMGEIAFKVGFNNQSHFNRVFKAMEGISPSEFRLNKNL
jgi:AraC-like DNA-binding protein